MCLMVVLASLLGRVSQNLPLDPIPLSVAGLLAAVLLASYFAASSFEARQRVIKARAREQGGGRRRGRAHRPYA